MPALNIREVDEATIQKAKMGALAAGKTLREYIIGLIEAAELSRKMATGARVRTRDTGVDLPNPEVKRVGHDAIPSAEGPTAATKSHHPRCQCSLCKPKEKK